MIKLLIILLNIFIVFLFIKLENSSGHEKITTPCDIKGISVGDKMSELQIMRHFNIGRFIDKDALVHEPKDSEEVEFGPYCSNNQCSIPNSVHIGNNDIVPAKMRIYFDNSNKITGIVMSFNERYWENVLPIINSKYGDDWRIDKNQMLISNESTRKGMIFDQVGMIHKSHGTNSKTGDQCRIYATNFDSIFEHTYDYYGPYHSEIMIELISKNL